MCFFVYNEFINKRSNSMQLRTLRTATVSLVAAMSLCACASLSLPGKGYKKYKNYCASVLEAKGYSAKAIKFNSCNYVWITGDGTMDADILKDTVWYDIRATLTLNGYSSPFHACVLYSKSSDSIDELESSSYYEDAYYLVSTGALKGKTGSL